MIPTILNIDFINTVDTRHSVLNGITIFSLYLQKKSRRGQPITTSLGYIPFGTSTTKTKYYLVSRKWLCVTFVIVR